VGILDTATNTFSTVATTGDARYGVYKYEDAAVVGTKVYFGQGLTLVHFSA
jgi:hypothetical protein